MARASPPKPVAKGQAGGTLPGREAGSLASARAPATPCSTERPMAPIEAQSQEGKFREPGRYSALLAGDSHLSPWPISAAWEAPGGL